MVWVGVRLVVVVVGRLSVVSVLQGAQYPGLAAPSTTTLAPQHRHNTNVTLLLQLDNIKLNINCSNSHSIWHGVHHHALPGNLNCISPD